MLLTAIKEMKVGKGASINAVFTYLRTMYKYDPLKNRTHIKKTLTKIITEGLVEQVKGRGLAGSFKLGKNYKEKKKKPVSPVSIYYISVCILTLALGGIMTPQIRLSDFMFFTGILLGIM